MKRAQQVYRLTESLWHIKVDDEVYHVPVEQLKDFYINKGLTPLPAKED